MAKTHEFLMNQAIAISQGSTCDRANVGAIVVRNDNIIGRGFNTSAGDLPTCSEVGHLLIDDHCCRTIHAEHNAILDALKYTTFLSTADMYVTHEPCIHCRKLIVQMGIRRVIYKYAYRSNYGAAAIAGDTEWIHYDELQENLHT